MDAPHNLLVIACGGAKHPTPAGPVRAIDLYQGRQFALARRLHAQGWSVLIMSAKHGLIDADRKIEAYDVRMTPDRARAAVAQVGKAGSLGAALFRVWSEDAARVVFYGGIDYFRVFEALMAASGPPTYRDDGSPACDTTQIVGAGCGEHFSVLAEIVAEEGA